MLMSLQILKPVLAVDNLFGLVPVSTWPMQLPANLAIA